MNFQWDVEGVQAVYFFHDGQNWKDHGVTGHERRQECPSQSLTYYLHVIKNDGSHEQPAIRIEVGGGSGQPDRPPKPPTTDPGGPPKGKGKAVIEQFSVNPGQIRAGECVTISWRCGGETAWVNIFRGEHAVRENAGPSGSVQDCPKKPGDYNYRIIAYDRDDKHNWQDHGVRVTG